MRPAELDSDGWGGVGRFILRRDAGDGEGVVPQPRGVGRHERPVQVAGAGQLLQGPPQLPRGVQGQLSRAHGQDHRLPRQVWAPLGQLHRRRLLPCVLPFCPSMARSGTLFLLLYVACGRRGATEAARRRPRTSPTAASSAGAGASPLAMYSNANRTNKLTAETSLSIGNNCLRLRRPTERALRGTAGRPEASSTPHRRHGSFVSGDVSSC
jgi:hypothetical protein